jgi:putative tricarboxylic transport membrane protein
LESILQAAWEGLLLTLSWPNVLYPIIGTLLAMVVAVLPGLSGVTLMVLAIPFTVGWDKVPTMLLFGAFVGGATFMGSVTSILLNIPGKSSNAATRWLKRARRRRRWDARPPPRRSARPSACWC